MPLPSPIEPWTPATEDDIDGALEALDCLGSRATEAAAMHLQAYHVALEGATRYGVVQAVKRILQGALGHAFMPNPAELRMQHDAVMKPHHETAEREERRRRVAEDMDRFAPRSRHEGERERVKAIYDRFQRHCAEVGTPADLEELRAKYDPALLDRIPDRPSAAPEGFEHLKRSG